MCIDYGETINTFTVLDGYPLPNVQTLVNIIAQYRHFTNVDLRCAEHQIEIPVEDRPFVVSEA